MLFLRALFGIFIILFLAVLLGWTRKFKHPAAFTYVWIGSIILLLVVRYWL